MSKQRFKSVSTSALTSKKLARLEALEERLFWRIHYASDSYGTMSGDPWDVLQQAVPAVRGYDLDTVTRSLEALVAVKLLERWQEPDGEVWVHVIDHDRHQSAYYRSKRGERHTPIPPSLRPPESKVPTGTAPESSASRAEVSPTGPARYPLEIGGGGEVGAAIPSTPLTTTEPFAHTSAPAHEATHTTPAVEKPLPPNQRSPEARIRQAQRDLEPFLSTVIVGMVARRNSASDRMLSAADEFERFWRPACELLAEHGMDRVREALRQPGADTATSVKYLATIANRLTLEAMHTTTNPDVGTGDWDHLTPKAS